MKPKRIEVSFVRGARLKDISKTYDTNGEFEFKEDNQYRLQDAIFQNQQGEKVGYNYPIILTGKALDGDGNEIKNAGKYENIWIEITGAKVNSGGEIPDNAFDLSELEGKKLECNVNISKLNVDVTFKRNTIRIQYKRNEINKKLTRENTDFISDSADITKYTDEEKRNLKNRLFSCMDSKMTIDKENEMCIFSSVVYGEKDPNVQYNLKIVDENLPEGTYHYDIGPQEFTSEDGMEKKIFISQNQNGKKEILAGDEKWINKSELYFQLMDEEYEEYYKNFSFAEAGHVVKDGKVIVNTNIPNGLSVSKNNSEGVPSGIKLDDIDKGDKYVQVIISDKDGNYKSIAMFVRIVSEDRINEPYETTIMGDDGVTYSIVNLYMDATGDTVEFSETVENEEGGENKQQFLNAYNIDSDFNKVGFEKKEKYMETGNTIPVTITNTYSAIQKVEYKIVAMDWSKDWTAELRKKGKDDANWKAAKAIASQEIELTSEITDGNYVMFVRMTDKVGNRSTYVSNGFVVDNDCIFNVNSLYYL